MQMLDIFIYAGFLIGSITGGFVCYRFGIIYALGGLVGGAVVGFLIAAALYLACCYAFLDVAGRFKQPLTSNDHSSTVD